MSTTSNAAARPTILGQLVAFLLCLWAAWFCLHLGPAGPEWAQLLGVLFVLAAIASGLRLLAVIGRWLGDLRRHQRLESFASHKGQAKMGDLKAAKAAGLTGPEGWILGRIGKHVLRYSGEAAMLISGPPGSWKGVAFVLLNLLNLPKPTGDRWQSYVVLDVALELYAVSGNYLRAMGYRVVVICPEAERLAKELGISIESVQLNPLSYLKADDPCLAQEIEMAVRMIHPGVEPAKRNGTNEHFDDRARQILACFCYWLLHRYGTVTLPSLRRLTMASTDELRCVLEEGASSEAFGGAMAELARSLLTLMDGLDESTGAFGTAQRSVHLYSASSPLGRHVSDSTFWWSELHDQPTVVFVGIPLERLASQRPFLGLTIETAAQTLVRKRSNRRVSFLLDEIGNIYVPTLMEIVAGYRKCGLQCIFVLQQMCSQTSRVYGKEFSRELLGNCEVVLSLSTSELDDLKRLSEMAGHHTVADGSHTLAEGDEPAPKLSYTGSYQSQPLLRPETIRLLPKSQGVMLMRNQPPFILDLMNYLQDPVLVERAAPNPYYREEQSA